MSTTMKKQNKKNKAESAANVPDSPTVPPVDLSAVDQQTVSVNGATVSLGKSLCQKALLIGVSISLPAASKKDKEATQETATDNKAEVSQVRVWKSLLSGDEWNKVVSLSGKIRLAHYNLTAPWGNDGMRLIPTKEYVRAKLELEKLIREFYNAAEECVNAYPQLMANAKAKLGDLYSIADYPSPDAFKSRFSASLRVSPVPSSEFRSGHLTDSEIAEIGASIETAIAENLKQAERSLLERVLGDVEKKKGLAHLLNRLNAAGGEGRFHASTVDNVLEACAEADALNVNENETISKVVSSVRDAVKGIDTELVRLRDNVRVEAVKTTQAAVETVQNAMRDFF